jgi:tetratricopeptide (TPR) repeat protein
MRKILLILLIFTMAASVSSHLFQQKWHFYRKAEGAFFKEHYEEALLSYLQSLRWGFNEEQIAPHFVATLGKLGGGMEKIDPFLSRLKKEGQKAHLLIKISMIFLLENHPNEAEKILKTVTIKKMKSSFAHMLLARALFLQGKGRESIAAYKKAMEKDLHNDPLRHEFAKVLSIEKHYEEAYLQYQKLLEKRKTPALSLEMADLLFLQQKTWAALEVIESLNLEEMDEKTELFLARVYAKENLFEKAERAYLFYLEKKPEDLTARMELAELYLLQKKYVLATEEYRKIIEKNPQDRYLRRSFALSLLREYRIEEAKQELLLSLFEKSQNSQVPSSKRISDFHARLLLARLYHLQDGNLETSLQHYQFLVKEKPNDAKLHMEMGEIYQKLQQLDNAMEAFQTVMILEPKNLRAQIHLAKIFLERKEYQKALVFSKTMPKSSPLVQKFLLDSARALKEEQKVLEAIHFYKDFVERVEDRIALEEIADLYLEVHQMHNSLFYYQKALKMDPGSKSLKAKIRLAMQKTQETISSQLP